jgi:hypothetical protein
MKLLRQALPFILVASLAITMAACSASPSSSSESTKVAPESAATTNQQQRQQRITLPRDETDLISTIADFRHRYESASNEFQKSALRRNRGQALSQILSDRNVQNWIGVVSSMTTTSDGHGSIALKVPETAPLTIKTWNNGHSDVADGTLISPESPVYEQVSRLAIGTTVVFSGSFLSSEMDYVEEASVTEEGSMMEPELIFRFEAIRPWTPEHAN